MEANHSFTHSEANPMMLSNSDPSCRWVKRLQQNPLDTVALAKKRLKTGDGQSNGEVQNLVISILDYDKCSSDLSNRFECQNEYNCAQLVLKNCQCTSAELEATHYWIRRWCRPRQQTAAHPKLATLLLCKQQNSEVNHEIFEGKRIPSITAMALMAKAANSLHPREFQRRESFMVWNTEGF